MWNFGRMMLAALSAAFVLPALPATATVTEPPPDDVTIDAVMVNGSGCRHGSAVVTLAPDKNSFTVERNGMRAEAGGNAAPMAFRVYCSVILWVHVPQEYRYTIRPTGILYGSADLESTATGSLTTEAYFQATSDTRPMTRTLHGPFSGHWGFAASGSRTLPSPCDVPRYLSVKTELLVELGTSDPSKTNYMAADGKETYEISWGKCPTR